MSRGALVLFSLCGLAALVASTPARGECAPSRPGLLWSFPADGQADVPTNAHFWFLTSNAGAPTAVLLDGISVPSSGNHALHYAPGDLQPNTAYELRVTHSVHDDAAEAIIHFTTGDGPDDDVPIRPVIAEHLVLDLVDLEWTCGSILFAGVCFDTGPVEHHVFDAVGDPLLWRVLTASDDDAAARDMLWPAACGPPMSIIRGAAPGAAPQDVCFTVSAIARSGSAASAQTLCSAPVEVAAPREAPRGCAAADGAMLLSGPGLFALRRRRPSTQQPARERDGRASRKSRASA